jgi:hypothetical protein
MTLLLFASDASAQLLLSGRTTGSFANLAQPNTTVNNASDGSFAVFKTGIPAPGSFKSSIVFSNETFTNVSSGDAIQVGLFVITNGITKLGTGAPTAVFNLGLELTSPEAQSLVLSQFTFTITHTPNLPDYTNVPDSYAVTFTVPPSTTVAGRHVWFDVVVDPAEFSLSEGSSTVKGALYVHFSPVPEPAIYGAAAGVLLGGLICWRRRRKGIADVAGIV